MGLDYVDFIPECLDEGGIFSEAKYERFDGLMARANRWLQSRPDYRVLTCESIELKQKDGAYVQPEKMSFYERGEHINRFVRALRFWLRRRDAHEPPEPQQLGFWNVVPLNTEEGGIFSKPKFENLGTTLNRLNRQFKERPLAGSILNIETQDMKCHTSLGTADPDECSWRESGKTGVYYVMVLRIFFVLGPPAYEEIGCADFVPRHQGYSKEGFGGVLAQARSWLEQQQGLRFINVQSIDYKLKRDWGGDSLDTHRTSYYERGEGYTYYIRIVRVCYGTRYVQDGMGPPPMPAPRLNYKTFSPICLAGGGFGSPTYETMSETWRRAKAWLSHANIHQYLSVETVPVRLYSGKQYGDPEVTYTSNHGDRNEFWLFVLRVYINGPYTEPPREVLPPEPEPVEDDCCVIL